MVPLTDGRYDVGMPQTLDAIVIGTGGVGSAALHHFALRGLRVVGVDRFPPGHDRGSSHGATRVIRQAYFEHPDYVPLLQQAYRQWEQLEQPTGTTLLHRVGLLEIGPPDGVVLPGVRDSARRHRLDVDDLDHREVAQRFPGLRMPEGYEAVFERQAGYLLVEECVRAHVEAAVRLGATLHRAAVRQWHSDSSGHVRVQTDQGELIASQLVIAAGAWTSPLLHDLQIPLRVLRKHLHWFSTDHPHYDVARGCPTYLYELPDGIYYGFPRIDSDGVKVGEHSGGTECTDPLNDPRGEETQDVQRVQSFVHRCLPRLTGPRIQHSVCFYTMSPDEHFIVDRHPDDPHVGFVAGLSGHGFKLTNVLAQAIVDQLCDGHTDLPVGFLSLARFA